MGVEAACRWPVLPAGAVRAGRVKPGEIGRRGWIRGRSGAVRCGGAVLRSRKNCKAQFDPALNHPAACRFHTAHFGDSFANYASVRNSQLLRHRKIEHGLSFIWYKQIGFGWKNHIQIPKRSTFGRLSIDKKDEHLIKVVAPVDPTSVPTVDDGICTTTLEYGGGQVSQFSHEESPKIDDREKLRRMRISKANKGNVPWNKGKKHSQETLQRIRERTKLAMQDPKVKMKLVNLGHAQSEDTRLKIGVGVREGWQRRREKLMVQEGCCIEWQNAIAEAARDGLAGEEELHWDSYKIIDEQLRQEWLESVERRKTMPRLKGSKRAPKSPEQRRKISESISAKWADPGYRERVCSALAKYHGTPIGAERGRRRKPPAQTAVKKEPVIKKPMQPKSSSTETKITKSTSKKKKNSTPSYKDPMASTKLEMIKKIKVRRAALEANKKDAIERAKLLITEAEKAAKALEMAALKSPIARVSLLETRKLIAKATRSIEGINHGQVPMQDTAEDISSDSAMSERSAGSQNCEDVPDGRLINGEIHLFLSNNGSYKDFGKSTGQVVVNGREFSSVPDSTENSTEVFHHDHSHSSESESERKDVSSINLLIGSSTVNGSIVHNRILPAGGDESLRINEDEVSTSATKTKLKWVCGKLVEVEED